MNDLTINTTPDANRKRSYDGDYMARGKTTELVVMQWLKDISVVERVEDLRSDTAMQRADIDCRIYCTGGRIILAEIKSDRHLGKSGNFLFEVLRINHTSRSERAVTLGWSARSQAELLLMHNPGINILDQILMSEHRQAFQNATAEMRGDIKRDYVPTDKIKSTYNFLIPERFVTVMPSYKRHNLNGEPA